MSDRRREARACVSCGYVRVVLISRYKTRVAGQTEWVEEDHWTQKCTACDLERRAAVHLHAAQHFKAKADAIRAKRRAGFMEARAKRAERP